MGGDGLFQEVLNGVLATRAAGGEAGVAAASLRLGHIPAGDPRFFLEKGLHPLPQGVVCSAALLDPFKQKCPQLVLSILAFQARRMRWRTASMAAARP